MVIYISTARKPTDSRSLRFSFGVSRSRRASSCAVYGSAIPSAGAAPFTLAPYPAASTARMISSRGAVPSTPMELVSRLTDTEDTPGTFPTAFSTRAWHAAQLMPVTIYCSIGFPLTS